MRQEIDGGELEKRLSQIRDSEHSVKELEAKLKIAVTALDALAKRHDWHPELGKCICAEHKDAKAALEKIRGEGAV